MPHSLQVQLSMYGKKHQFGGIYCVSTNESRYWRVEHGHQPVAYKVGKSWDILNRMNTYLTYTPWQDHGGVRLHFVVIMEWRTKDAKSKISESEAFVLSELKKAHPDKTNWPGTDDKTRLFFSKSEWMEGLPISEVEALFKQVAAKHGGRFVDCGPNTNVPKEFYFWKRHQQETGEEARVLKKAQDEKDEALQRQIAKRRRLEAEIYAQPQDRAVSPTHAEASQDIHSSQHSIVVKKCRGYACHVCDKAVTSYCDVCYKGAGYTVCSKCHR